ncbi:MAG TPA: TraR/DksA C4-type zinc finger protein [Actinomycetota bacterium]|jgi:DnaK suppressor protein
MVKKQPGLAKTTPNPVSPAGKGSGRKAAFDRKTLAAIRGQLVAQQEELLAQLEEIEEATSATTQPDISGDVSFDEDSVDAGSFTAEREKDLSIAQNVRDLLDKMTKALHKIDDGTYGICESCGEPIEAARLKALPHVLLCLSCKKAEERR